MTMVWMIHRGISLRWMVRLSRLSYEALGMLEEVAALEIVALESHLEPNRNLTDCSSWFYSSTHLQKHAP